MQWSIESPGYEGNCRLSAHGTVVTIGSCFASHIGNAIYNDLIEVNINPFGIVYQPLVIAYQLEVLLNQQCNFDLALIANDGLWHSLFHHGSFSHADKATAIDGMQKRFDVAVKSLNHAQCVIITLGSAYYYRHLQTGIIAANCHKIPNTQFKKSLASMDEIVHAFTMVLEQLHASNPQTQVIFTVSPVRYIRDGLINNTKSKSILHLAVHELVHRYKFCSYFPAYEIMLDELRDYRFYEADLIHPNALAVQYIFEKFTQLVYEKETQLYVAEWRKINAMLKHRPINQSSPGFKKFKQQSRDALIAFEEKYPFASARIKNRASDNKTFGDK